MSPQWHSCPGPKYVPFFHAPSVHRPRYNLNHQSPEVRWSVVGLGEMMTRILQQSQAGSYYTLSKLLSTFPNHPPNFLHTLQTIVQKKKASQSASGCIPESALVCVFRLTR